MRTKCARVAFALAIIPTLVLGAFGGTTFVAHSHDGHGSHLHASSSLVDAQLEAEQHLLAHASGIATCDDPEFSRGCAEHDEEPAEHGEGPHHPLPIEEPGEIVITIPDHEQIVARGIDLARTLEASDALQCFLACLWTQTDLSEETGSPGGWVVVPAHYLSAFTAGQRLVRTSQALLI